MNIMSGVVIKREPQSSIPEQQQTEKKQYEGRKHAIISPDTIKTIAEANGIAGLNQDVAAFISNDASYRLYEILHGCTVFLRHARRHNLTSAEVDAVLRDLNIPPILGVPRARPVQVPEADVFIMPNETVNLLDLAFRPEKFKERGFTFLTDTWVACEPLAEPAPFIKQEPREDPDVPVIPLSAPMQTLLSCLGSALLGPNQRHLQEALGMLRSSGKLATLATPLLNLLVLGLQDLPRRRLALLSAASALLENPGFWIAETLPVFRLISALLMCALEPSAAPGVTRDEEIDVKLKAATVLGSVVSVWCRDEPSALSDALSKLYSTLYDGGRPARTHLGALAALTALGPAALQRCLWPPIAQYLAFLDASPHNEDTGLVRAAILDAAEMLYRREMRHLSTPAPGLPALHAALSDAFGDALCARFAPAPSLLLRPLAPASVAPTRPLPPARRVPAPARAPARALGDHFDLAGACVRPHAEHIQMHFAGGKPMAKRRRTAGGGVGRQPPSAYVMRSRELGCVGRLHRRPRPGGSLEHVLFYVL